MNVRVEQRRYARVSIETPASFSLKGHTERREGICKDLSIGGVFLETDAPAGFGAEIVIHLVLPGATAASALPGVVRWLRDGGMGVQFGLIGAVETHLITEIGRKSTAGA